MLICYTYVLLYIRIYYSYMCLLYRKEDIEEVIGYTKHNCLSSAIHPVIDTKTSMKNQESKE